MAHAGILVTGATGDTGGYTVEQLLKRNYSVRALAHRQDARSRRLQELGAEVVIGDFLDFEAMRAAMQGIRGAYFCYPIRPGILQATAYFTQAAKEAGVECIVNMSQKSSRENARSHAAQDHWLSEQIFDWSGVAVTHLRPTYFAEWLLYLAPMIRAGVLHVPFGTGRHAPTRRRLPSLPGRNRRSPAEFRDESDSRNRPHGSPALPLASPRGQENLR